MMEGSNALWPCIGEDAAPGVAVLSGDVKWPAAYRFSGIRGEDILEVGAFRTNPFVCWYGMLHGDNNTEDYVTPQTYSADAGRIQFLRYCCEGSFYDGLR